MAIRLPPDNDTAWGSDVRAAISRVNDLTDDATGLIPVAKAVGPVVSVTYAASLTLNAALGTTFRITATGNLAVTDVTGGVNGQLIALEVLASGGDRTLTVAGASVAIPSGQWWSGSMRFNSSTGAWLLDDGSGGGSSGGASYTDEQVDDRVNALIVAGANITKTYDDATGTLTLAAPTSGSGTSIVLTPSGGNDVSQITTALAAGNVILRGNFQMAGTVQIPSNRTVTGEGRAQITWTGATTGSTQFFEANTVSNVRVTGIRFVSNNSNSEVIALLVRQGTNCGIDHCEASRCRLLYATTVAAENYATNTSGLRSKDLFANHNTATGFDRATPATGAIEFRYVDGFTAVGNIIRTFSSGIVWWGGDSNFGGNGALTNERKCSMGTIVGNRVIGFGLGGIWGAMGHDIVIDSNYVEDCDDVCIDPEGSTNVSCTGNIAKNGKNGNFTVFFGVRNISFLGGMSIQDDASWPHFRTYNDSADGTLAPGPVVFRGVTCTTTTTSGAFGKLDNANGPVGHVVIQDCDLVNTMIEWGLNGNNRRIHIIDNTLLFERAAASTHIGINLGGGANFGGLKVIRGNTIETTVAQPATGITPLPNGSQSIYTYDDDPNNSPRLIVENNVQKGTWPGGMRFRWGGTNAGQRLFAIVRDNIASRIDVNSAGAGAAATVASADNFTESAAAVTVGTA